MLFDLLTQASEHLAPAIPIMRATEDAMLGYWIAQLQSILPQPTKEKK